MQVLAKFSDEIEYASPWRLFYRPRFALKMRLFADVTRKIKNKKSAMILISVGRNLLVRFRWDHLDRTTLIHRIYQFCILIFFLVLPGTERRPESGNVCKSFAMWHSPREKNWPRDRRRSGIFFETSLGFVFCLIQISKNVLTMQFADVLPYCVI